MSAQPILNELLTNGFTLDIEGEKLKVSPASNLTDELRQKIRAHKSELLQALRSKDEANRVDDYTEIFHERAAIAEYDGGITREQAEDMAIRTVWRCATQDGHKATIHTNCKTYEQTRAELEQMFNREITHLEFISALVDGYGFIPFTPRVH